MAYIKILIEYGDESKALIGKRRIDDFQKYQNLKEEILKVIKDDTDVNSFITPEDNFILRFVKDKKNKVYFPEELDECIEVVHLFPASISSIFMNALIPKEERNKNK